MRVAAFGICLFAATFLIHWLIWRIHVPRRPFLVLLAIFGGASLVALGVCTFFSEVAAQGPATLFEWLHVLSFHGALSLGYIEGYTALQEDSPSLKILLFVESAGASGRARDELYGLISNDFVVGSRLEALLTGGFLLPADGGRFALSQRGRRTLRMLGFFRRLWRLDVEG